jgi:hypothetical protein
MSAQRKGMKIVKKHWYHGQWHNDFLPVIKPGVATDNVYLEGGGACYSQVY